MPRMVQNHRCRKTVCLCRQMGNFIHVDVHAFIRERVFKSSGEFHSMT